MERKNIQLRLTNKNYEGLQRIAKEEGTTIADIVRQAIIIRAIAHNYQKEGKALMWEDKDGLRVELLIPGITEK